MSHVNTVKFWRTTNNQIIAQKANTFFAIPVGSGFGEDRDSRRVIADNFDSAPVTRNHMDLANAYLIAQVRPGVN